MLILILFLTGFLAGTIDAIAGGGGLLSIPVLLSVGVPPHLAFGTNKLQSSFGTFMAARRFHKQGLVTLKNNYFSLICCTLGAASGSVAAQLLSSNILRKMIPILLIGVLLYSFFSPKLGHHDEKPRMKEFWFFIFLAFPLGFYDGFFGPGVGSLWVFLLIYLLGYNLLKATAYTKLFNLNSNLVSLLCFALGGNIDYRIGLWMAAGQVIGGRVGAHLAIKKGAAIIRPLFLSIVMATVIVLIYKGYIAQKYHR